ncbi:MAG: hydrogenase nickel incorporation protein HypB [Rubrivivax sp.]|nr:hydrogenase nickel incorporation protein HypB [Rubrivivax sp.]
MCMTCGCGSGETRIEGADGAAPHVHTHADGTTHSHAHDHGDDPPHAHGHDHGHAHDHDHPHTHAHTHTPDPATLHYGLGAAGTAAPGMSQTRLVQIERDILAKNDGHAQRNRAALAARGVLALNLVSSPGSGKTTLLVRTIELLQGRLPVAVVEGDQQTSNDADRIRATGAPALQINTGKGCHLDAVMVETAINRLAPAEDSVLMIENVGNLVCPAGFDLGEAHKVVVLSVTEGEDKPLKYPDMFAAASLMLLNKIDLLPHLRFDVAACIANARRVNPAMQILQVSATSDEGLDAWLAWIARGAEAARAQRLGTVDTLQRRVAELEAQLARAQGA